MPYVTLTPAAETLLNQRRIFDAPRPGARRWRAGRRLFVAPEIQLEPYASLFAGEVLPLRMGAFSYSHSALPVHMQIGRYCSIGSGLSIMGGEHPFEWATTSPVGYGAEPLWAVRAFFNDAGGQSRPRAWSRDTGWGVHIGNDVWIGDGVMLAPYVKIGDGAVIGARAFVRKDVPPYAIVVGQPARVLRYRFAEPLIERLLALQWWRFTPDVVQQASIDQPEHFVDELPQLVEQLGARELRPVRLAGQALIEASQPWPAP